MQKQYTFNQDIRNEIEDAITKVVSGRVSKAKRLLEGCVNRIKKRNKLLKIVDKSPAGELIADEYETIERLCERLRGRQEHPKSRKSSFAETE